MAKANLSLLLLLLAFTSTCVAYTLYASPDGEGSVCSSTSPCALSTACNTVNSTDTLQLLAGTYDLETTCVIRGISVTVEGGEGVELACPGSCFSFEMYPFQVRNMTMRSTNATEAGTFIVSVLSETNEMAEAAGSVIEGIVAELDNSNFLYVDFYGSVTNPSSASFSLVDVSISGTAGNFNESVIYLGVGTPAASLELSDVSFTELTTSNFDSVISSTSSWQTLSLESVSVVNSTITSLITAKGTDAILTDVSVNNVTTYSPPEGKASSAIIYFNSFQTVTVNGLFFESVTDENGLVYSYGATTIVNNVVVENCVGQDDHSTAMVYATGGVAGNLTFTDITYSSSQYGMGLYLLQSSQYDVDVSISGLKVTDFTTVTWAFILAANCNLTLTDFTVSDSYLVWGFLDLPGIGSSSVSDGSVTDVTTSSNSIITNFYGYDSEEETFYDASFKNITFYNLVAYSAISITPANGTWTIDIEDCDVDTGDVVEVVNCRPDSASTGFATVTVANSPCDVTNACGMTGYGYDASTVCTITLDDESVCCDDVDANGNPVNSGDGLSGWAVFAVVAVVIFCVMFVVVGIIAAGLIILKKRNQDTYDTI